MKIGKKGKRDPPSKFAFSKAKLDSPIFLFSSTSFLRVESKFWIIRAMQNSFHSSLFGSARLTEKKIGREMCKKGTNLQVYLRFVSARQLVIKYLGLFAPFSTI